MTLPAGIKSVTELAVEGKRVFVRVDYNVPLAKAEAGGGPRKVSDDARIRATLPTVRHLIERGARIVLGSHLGRPDGEAKPEFSLEPVAARLAELLELDVTLADEPLVSCDYNGDLHSATVDAPLTTATGELVKVMAWYDNEMGYSQRLFDLAKFVAEKL